MEIGISQNFVELFLDISTIDLSVTWPLGCIKSENDSFICHAEALMYGSSAFNEYCLVSLEERQALRNNKLPETLSMNWLIGGLSPCMPSTGGAANQVLQKCQCYALLRSQYLPEMSPLRRTGSNLSQIRALIACYGELSQV